jgi:hypothetical protein
MEFLTVVKVAEAAEKLLSAADKLSEKAEKAKKVPQEDAKYYAAYLEVAGIVIQSLENEYLEILKQADRTNLKDRQQKELLRTRINDYLHGEVLRPKLTTAIEHLEAGRNAFKQHAKGFPLWPKVKDRKAALKKYAVLIDKIRSYLESLGGLTGASAPPKALAELKRIEAALSGAPKAFEPMINDLLMNLDKSTLLTIGSNCGRVIEVLRLAFR